VHQTKQVGGAHHTKGTHQRWFVHATSSVTVSNNMRKASPAIGAARREQGKPRVRRARDACRKDNSPMLHVLPRMHRRAKTTGSRQTVGVRCMGSRRSTPARSAAHCAGSRQGVAQQGTWQRLRRPGDARVPLTQAPARAIACNSRRRPSWAASASRRTRPLWRTRTRVIVDMHKHFSGLGVHA